LLTSVRSKLSELSPQGPNIKTLSLLLKENRDTFTGPKKETKATRENRAEQALSEFAGSLIEILENKRATLDSNTLRDAVAFGRARKRQGLSPTMLTEEFSSFQEEIYKLVQNNLEGMNTSLLLSDLRRLHSALSQLLAKAIEGFCGGNSYKPFST